jgi:hypothetical protein
MTTDSDQWVVEKSLDLQAPTNMITKKIVVLFANEQQFISHGYMLRQVGGRRQDAAGIGHG